MPLGVDGVLFEYKNNRVLCQCLKATPALGFSRVAFGSSRAADSSAFHFYQHCRFRSSPSKVAQFQNNAQPAAPFLEVRVQPLSWLPGSRAMFRAAPSV